MTEEAKSKAKVHAIEASQSLKGDIPFIDMQVQLRTIAIDRMITFWKGDFSRREEVHTTDDLIKESTKVWQFLAGEESADGKRS